MIQEDLRDSSLGIEGAALGEAGLLLIPGRFKHKASSVLNRSAEFASRNMFDGSVETCWNSDQGSPQYLSFDFGPDCVVVTSVSMMFQGGFVGQDALIECSNESSDASSFLTIAKLDRIEDCNRLQSFEVASEAQPPLGARYIRVTFPSSTDFYGRVTLYRLELHGWRFDAV